MAAVTPDATVSPENKLRSDLKGLKVVEETFTGVANNDTWDSNIGTVQDFWVRPTNAVTVAVGYAASNNGRFTFLTGGTANFRLLYVMPDAT